MLPPAWHDEVWDALRTIDDPEMPISIVDLGIIEDVGLRDNALRVKITPTYTGCPALDLIDREVVQRLAALDCVIQHGAQVEIEHVFDPPWSPQRISPAGRERLHAHGVTVSPPQDPNAGAAAPVALSIGASDPIACPFCGSAKTRVDSPFGPTRCRATHYCEDCHNPFEHMKQSPRTA